MTTNIQRDLSIASKTRLPVGIGFPGLWKNGAPDGISVFPVPSSCLGEPGLEAAFNEWAARTGKGRVSGNWKCPTEEFLEEILPGETRVIRSGMVLRNLDVIHDEERLSLQLPLTSWEGELPGERAEWLEALLTSANSRWPLVRFGIAPDGRSARAEVNFTGAPPEVFAPVLPTALLSFRWIVAGLAETADFITRSDSASEVLTEPPAALRKSAAA